MHRPKVEDLGEGGRTKVAKKWRREPGIGSEAELRMQNPRLEGHPPPVPTPSPPTLASVRILLGLIKTVSCVSMALRAPCVFFPP